MAWSTPKTWTSGYVVLASDLNTYIKDQQLETAPAKVSAEGDIVYATGANALARLAKDANPTRSLTNTGTNNVPAWAQVALATGVSGQLPVGSGGTGTNTLTANGALIGNGSSAITAVDMSTKGGLLAGDGTGNPSVLPVGGTGGHVLTVDSGEATGMKWAAGAGASLGVAQVYGTRSASAGAGDQAIAGVGFTPRAGLFFCALAGTDIFSFGLCNPDLEEILLATRQDSFEYQALVMYITSGGNSLSAVVKTWDADGLTLTWSKYSAGVDASYLIMVFE